jgi:hypothetical protein
MINMDDLEKFLYAQPHQISAHTVPQIMERVKAWVGHYKYNHMFSMCFTIDTDVSIEEFEEDPTKISVTDLKAAMLRRVEDVTRGHAPEVYEAIDFRDTYDH